MINTISKQLLSMAKKDQVIRNKYCKEQKNGYIKEMNRIDKDNRKRFKEIFKETGLITSEYGKDVQEAAFLIVQHMPRTEIKFMQNYLSLMEKNIK